MKPITESNWKLSGDGLMTDAQRRLLNASCGDLGDQLPWHGMDWDKDDYRHMIAGTLLGWRSAPGIDMGDGRRGWIMLGGSSLKLTRSQATDAITLAFHIGDHPEEQGIKARPVRWCHVVRAARGISDADDELAARHAA